MQHNLRAAAIYFCVLVSLPELIAQTSFFNVYGTINNDEGSFIRELSSGDIFVAGGSTGSPNGGSDVLAMRLTSTGAVVWNKYYDMGYNSYLVDCDLSPSQEAYLLISPCNVIKTDMNGDTLWMRTYYESEPCYGSSIVATADGGFAILALQISPAGPPFSKIIRGDANGNILWSNVYSNTESTIKIVECTNGDLVAACRPSNISTEILRVDLNGNPISITIYTGSYDEIVRDIAVVGNEIIMTGRYWDNTLWQTYGYVRRIDATNNIVWEKILQYGQEFQPRNLDVQGSTVTLMGDIDFPSYEQGFIVQISINGVLQSQHAYSFNTATFMKDVYCNAAGQVFITGEITEAFWANDSGSVMVFRVNPVTQSICGQSSFNVTMTTGATTLLTDNFAVAPSGYSMPWTCTISSGISMLSGCTVGIDDAEESAISIYPNPATNQFVVHSTTSPNGNWIFVLRNSLGQEIKRVVLTQQEQTISCEEIVAGIYFYSILSEGELIGSGKLIKE